MMTKQRIWLKVVTQIQKDLMNTLFNCRASFEIDVPRSFFTIKDVVGFNLDDTHNSEPQYEITINTENNTKAIFIAKANILEFTVHFNQ